jgi:hypothetical protein
MVQQCPCRTMQEVLGRRHRCNNAAWLSVVGSAFLLALFIPNIRWAKRQPAGYEELQKRESRVLLVLERVGQVLTTCTSLIFVCPEGASFSWVLVLVAAALLMILYEIAWIRYFRDGERLDGMYQPLGSVPVPIASLPIAAFVLLGIWHKSPLAAISAIILAVGHIGIHLGHLHELEGWQP